jgi:hypothetical protein
MVSSCIAAKVAALMLPELGASVVTDSEMPPNQRSQTLDLTPLLSDDRYASRDAVAWAERALGHPAVPRTDARTSRTRSRLRSRPARQVRLRALLLLLSTPQRISPPQSLFDTLQLARLHVGMPRLKYEYAVGC